MPDQDDLRSTPYWNVETDSWAPVGGGGGGGASPVNWARLTLANPGTPLTVAAGDHQWGSGEVTISAQAGTDFSVTDDGFGNAIVRSAGGGRFQCAAYLANPDNATLDGASDAQRYLWFGVVVGEDTGPLGNFGLDAMVPILVSPAQGRFFASNCCASALGYCDPGGMVASHIKISLVNGVGTDSVPLSAGFGFDNFIVYQV